MDLIVPHKIMKIRRKDDIVGAKGMGKYPGRLAENRTGEKSGNGRMKAEIPERTIDEIRCPCRGLLSMLILQRTE